MKNFWKEKDIVAVHAEPDGIVFWITFQSFGTFPSLNYSALNTS